MRAWAIPPKADAAFAAAMERVLAAYAAPYDPAYPVVCLDERPCVLRAEARAGLPVRPGGDATRDCEYVRGGTACLTCAFEPARAWRRTWVEPRRRAVDFAAIVRELLDVDYADAARVRLVCDNLNTHAEASLYAAFAPAEARRLCGRLEFVHTPVHGSWLNMVECEFAVFVRECLGGGARAIASVEVLRAEAAAWAARRNRAGGTVAWELDPEAARVRLGRLYPSVVA